MLEEKTTGIKKLRETHGHESTHYFAKFNKDECGIYLQYKKQPSKDPGMPKELKERRARCLEWMNCPSPMASPNSSDDKSITNKEDAPADVIAGLLGLASNSLEWGAGGQGFDGENIQGEEAV